MNHEERLTEVIWRAECGEHTGEELQTHLHLRTVAVPASHTHTHTIYNNVRLQCFIIISVECTV